MLDLREVGIGVALVDQRVEILQASQIPISPLPRTAYCRFFVLGELARLPRVILPVEFAYAGRRRFVEFAEVLGLTIRVVALRLRNRPTVPESLEWPSIQY